MRYVFVGMCRVHTSCMCFGMFSAIYSPLFYATSAAVCVQCNAVCGYMLHTVGAMLTEPKSRWKTPPQSANTRAMSRVESASDTSEPSRQWVGTNNSERTQRMTKVVRRQSQPSIAVSSAAVDARRALVSINPSTKTCRRRRRRRLDASHMCVWRA